MFTVSKYPTVGQLQFGIEPRGGIDIEHEPQLVEYSEQVAHL